MRDLYAHLLHVFGHSFVLIRQLSSKSVLFKGGSSQRVFIPLPKSSSVNQQPSFFSTFIKWIAVLRLLMAALSVISKHNTPG